MSGMPQGRVLGPLLFAMYISPVGNVISAHGLWYHKYVDDMQVYMAVQPGHDLRVTMCVDDVARWFLENGLLLNPTDMEAVLFSTTTQRKKIPTASAIDVAEAVVPFCDTVKLLGVTLDSSLSMNRHVTEVVRSCSYHTRALHHIRPLLTLDVAKSVGHSIVSSRLDYSNALRSVSATKLRRQLHWLPIWQRIIYKVAIITYKTTSTKILAYLSDTVHDYHPARILRYGDQLLLTVP